MDIQFKMPVEIVMQEHCVQQRASTVSTYGKRAILVADSQENGSGALEEITAMLRRTGISYVTSNVTGDDLTPTGICGLAKELRPFGAEFIISSGGITAVNTGKALSLLAAQESPVSEADIANGRFPSTPIPHIVIPTTTGAGGEATPFMTLLGGSDGELLSYSDPALFARLVLLDSRYTAAVPWEAMVHTVFLTIGCAVEAILAADSSKLIRAIARESLADTCAVLSALEEDQVDTGIRRMMMYDSVLAGIAIGQTHASGLGSIGRLIARDQDIPHGKTVGLLLAPYLSLVWRKKPHLTDRILHSMGFQNLDSLSQKIHLLLPNRETFSCQDIERWALAATSHPDVGNCSAVLSKRDISQMLRMV